jgi:hypothetical protein
MTDWLARIAGSRGIHPRPALGPFADKARPAPRLTQRAIAIGHASLETS